MQSGRQGAIVSAIIRSSRSSDGVKSGPASAAVAPFLEISITPISFFSSMSGALMIFWMGSPRCSSISGTASKTEACGTTEKWLIISGRLSRAVRRARRQRVGTRQRNLPYRLQLFWSDKLQEPAVVAQGKDGNFVALNRVMLPDQVHHAI